MHLLQVAHVSERADHRDDVGQLGEHPGVRVLRDQLGHADQVVLVLLVRCQLGHRQRRHHVPGGVVDEVVLVVGAYERGQVRGVRERVEVVLVTEERLPFLAVLTPPRGPQRDQVALGQPEFDRDDVLGHQKPPGQHMFLPAAAPGAPETSAAYGVRVNSNLRGRTISRSPTGLNSANLSRGAKHAPTDTGKIAESRWLTPRLRRSDVSDTPLDARRRPMWTGFGSWRCQEAYEKVWPRHRHVRR